MQFLQSSVFQTEKNECKQDVRKTKNRRTHSRVSAAADAPVPSLLSLMWTGEERADG